MGDFAFRPKPKRGMAPLGLIFLLLLSSGAGAALGYYILESLPDPERITERSVAQSTKIYDRSGKIVLYEIHGEEKRTVIPLGEIPEYVKWATLMAEDDNFYRHRGIDLKGIGRAFLKNLMRGNPFRGQGGSTITQQLVKNSVLTNEVTLARKLREAIMAVALESKYSKDEILELYLNQIPYGSNAYGIASAAQAYFGKNVPDLTLSESSLLAALLKAPTYYSPYGSHQGELLARKEWVIQRMAEEGLISEEEAERAKKEKLALEKPAPSIRAPHFVLYVREYLDQKYGADFVERGGLKVITTLDWDLQQKAEISVREGTERNKDLVEAYNAALVAVDPRTGEVLALVGSYDFFGKSEPEGCNPGINCKFDPHVNVAVRQRQPGSAFKPFVYATAFKKGYTPETVVFDAPTEFNPLCSPEGLPGPDVKDAKDCYHPQNYDDKFRGPVTLRQAIAQSLNVPSVKVLYLAGVMDSIETARNLGISTLTRPERYGLSLVLGGAEVTLLEMTSAFGVLAQEGLLVPPASILRIENAQGVVLEEKKTSPIPVLDTEITRVINDVLSDNEARLPLFSPTSSLYFPERPVAAKTGTTQDFRDAWVIGYTPSLVSGVWAGNNDNSPMNKSALSIMVAGPIWHQFLASALEGSPPEAFTPPSSGRTPKPALNGVYRTGELITIDKISKKLATAFTPLELVEEKSFGEPKTILHFVKRDDPLGPPPSSPEDDPQYTNWQKAVEKWLAKNALPDARPPKDKDDIHTPEKAPRVLLLAPILSENKTASDVKALSFRISSLFGLKEASLFINDGLVGSKTAESNSSLITFPLERTLAPGAYQIKITAYDAVGNKTEAQYNITVLR